MRRSERRARARGGKGGALRRRGGHGAREPERFRVHRRPGALRVARAPSRRARRRARRACARDRRRRQTAPASRARHPPSPLFASPPPPQPSRRLRRFPEHPALQRPRPELGYRREPLQLERLGGLRGSLLGEAVAKRIDGARRLGDRGTVGTDADPGPFSFFFAVSATTRPPNATRAFSRDVFFFAVARVERPTPVATTRATSPPLRLRRGFRRGVASPFPSPPPRATATTQVQLLRGLFFETAIVFALRAHASFRDRGRDGDGQVLRRGWARRAAGRGPSAGRAPGRGERKIARAGTNPPRRLRRGGKAPGSARTSRRTSRWIEPQRAVQRRPGCRPDRFSGFSVKNPLTSRRPRRASRRRTRHRSSPTSTRRAPPRDDASAKTTSPSFPAPPRLWTPSRADWASWSPRHAPARAAPRRRRRRTKSPPTGSARPARSGSDAGADGFGKTRRARRRRGGGFGGERGGAQPTRTGDLRTGDFPGAAATGERPAMGAECVRKTGDADVGGVASFVAAAVSAHRRAARRTSRAPPSPKVARRFSFSFPFSFCPRRRAPSASHRVADASAGRAAASPRAAGRSRPRAASARRRRGARAPRAPRQPPRRRRRDSVRGAQLLAQRHGRGEVLGRRALEPRVDVLVVRRRVRRLEVEVVRRAKLPAAAADTTAVRG